MNEYLTILTTGSLITLFTLSAAFFLLAPDNRHHKRSLYRFTALFYILLLILNILFVVAMLWFPHLAMNWQYILALNLPLFPFVTFIVKEMLYPDKHVDGQTMLRHAGLPAALLIAFFVTDNLAPAATVWVLGLMIVWAVIYLAIMLPRAFMRVRRYNALVREIFVDTEGHSLTWMARLSLYLFTMYVAYGIFALFESNYLSAWLFNMFEFVVYLVLALQIARMRSNNLIHLDEPEEQPQEPATNPEPNTGNDTDAEKMIAQLEQWLKSDEHLRSSDLNREMVAHALHTNHATLAHILREQTGMTLTQFVTDLRMREAERLLRTTNLTVEEIFYLIGYQNRSTFSRLFQERNNCSATEWREQHQK